MSISGDSHYHHIDDFSDSPLARLLAWQPQAMAIRTTDCDICGGLMLSYVIEGLDKVRRREGWESCGYWCSECDFSNAGARLIVED